MGTSPAFQGQSYGADPPYANLGKVCKDLEINEKGLIERPPTKANLYKVCKDLQAKQQPPIFAENVLDKFEQIYKYGTHMEINANGRY